MKQKTPLVLPYRQEKTTKFIRLVNGKRRSSAAPACSGALGPVPLQQPSFSRPHRVIECRHRVLQVLVPQCLPHCHTAFDLSLTVMIAVLVSVRLCFSHLPQSLDLATGARMANGNRLAKFHTLAAQLLPRCSLDAHVDGLADCAPVFIHKRWSLSASPHIGGIDERRGRQVV